VEISDINYAPFEGIDINSFCGYFPSTILVNVILPTSKSTEVNVPVLVVEPPELD
jgi:hypothetical protein